MRIKIFVIHLNYILTCQMVDEHIIPSLKARNSHASSSGQIIIYVQGIKTQSDRVAKVCGANFSEFLIY
jgi:hypothetical protein